MTDIAIRVDNLSKRYRIGDRSREIGRQGAEERRGRGAKGDGEGMMSCRTGKLVRLQTCQPSNPQVIRPRTGSTIVDMVS